VPELLSQSDNLEVNEVPDGYIVYQTSRDRVHYLNKTAAIIFELCDGRRDVDDVVSRTAQAFELDQASHVEIRTCLDSLIKEGLVQFHSK
jgi:hypothetical protein